MTETKVLIEEEPMLAPEDLPDVEHLVTEDDTPVDNWFSEKQMRLGTRPVYVSWSGPGGGRPFLVAANVGLYYSVHEPALVPDILLSLDVEVPADWWAKRNRAYLVWELGKPPDVAIEIVSNKEGGEAGEKMRRYARAGVPYYVIFDPLQQIQDEVLQAYHLTLPQRIYTPIDPSLLAGVDLGLTLWQGEYEGREALWLRWQDAEGRLLQTGQERAEQAEQQREQERQRAEQAEQQREQERQRAEQAEQEAERARGLAERLAAQLRMLGIEPDQDTE